MKELVGLIGGLLGIIVVLGLIVMVINGVGRVQESLATSKKKKEDQMVDETALCMAILMAVSVLKIPGEKINLSDVVQMVGRPVHEVDQGIKLLIGSGCIDREGITAKGIEALRRFSEIAFVG